MHFPYQGQDFRCRKPSHARRSADLELTPESVLHHWISLSSLADLRSLSVAAGCQLPVEELLGIVLKRELTFLLDSYGFLM